MSDNDDSPSIKAFKRILAMIEVLTGKSPKEFGAILKPLVADLATEISNEQMDNIAFGVGLGAGGVMYLKLRIEGGDPEALKQEFISEMSAHEGDFYRGLTEAHVNELERDFLADPSKFDYLMSNRECN